MTKIIHHKIAYSSIFAGLLALLLLGCTSAIVAIDKPAGQTKNTKNSKATLDAAIKGKDLELADKKYLEFRGMHPESSRLPALMLKLSRAHMEAKEYLLARYYAEAYIKDYSSGRRVDQAWFLRIKSLFLRFQSNSSAQVLADHLKEEGSAFVSGFPRSKYRSDVKKMLKESQKIIRARNEEIAKSYERMGKKKAAAYYRDKNKK